MRAEPPVGESVVGGKQLAQCPHVRWNLGGVRFGIEWPVECCLLESFEDLERVNEKKCGVRSSGRIADMGWRLSACMRRGWLLSLTTHWLGAVGRRPNIPSHNPFRSSGCVLTPS